MYFYTKHLRSTFFSHLVIYANYSHSNFNTCKKEKLFSIKKKKNFKLSLQKNFALTRVQYAYEVIITFKIISLEGRDFLLFCYKRLRKLKNFALMLSGVF